jgi:hypothetical protein
MVLPRDLRKGKKNYSHCQVPLMSSAVGRGFEPLTFWSCAARMLIPEDILNGHDERFRLRSLVFGKIIMGFYLIIQDAHCWDGRIFDEKGKSNKSKNRLKKENKYKIYICYIKKLSNDIWRTQTGAVRRCHSQLTLPISPC